MSKVKIEIIHGNHSYGAGEIDIQSPRKKKQKKRRKPSLPFMFRLEIAGMLKPRGAIGEDLLYKKDQEFKPI